MKDLNELNSVLFETLEQVRTDKIDAKKAGAIVNVSNSIISSGKLQLQAYKMLHKGQVPEMMGLTSGNGEAKRPQLLSDVQSIKEKTGRDLGMEAFVKMLGYDSESEASADLGPLTLKNKYDTWRSNQ